MTSNPKHGFKPASWSQSGMAKSLEHPNRDVCVCVCTGGVHMLGWQESSWRFQRPPPDLGKEHLMPSKGGRLKPDVPAWFFPCI